MNSLEKLCRKSFKTLENMELWKTLENRGKSEKIFKSYEKKEKLRSFLE